MDDFKSEKETRTIKGKNKPGTRDSAGLYDCPLTNRAGCVSVSLNDIFENLSDPKLSLPEIYLGQRVFL